MAPLAVLAVACGNEQAVVNVAISKTPTSAEARPAMASGEPEPTMTGILDFQAPLIGGDVLRGVELTGQDTLFWFWAPH